MTVQSRPTLRCHECYPSHCTQCDRSDSTSMQVHTNSEPQEIVSSNNPLEVLPPDNLELQKSVSQTFTTWPASKNPQKSGRGAVDSFAVSPCALQLTVQWNSMEKKVFWSRGSYKLVFSLITDQPACLPHSTCTNKTELEEPLLFVLLRTSQKELSSSNKNIGEGIEVDSDKSK